MNEVKKAYVFIVVSIIAMAVIVYANAQIRLLPISDDLQQQDQLHLKGHFHGVLTDANGNVKNVIDKDNLIVTVGFKGVAKLAFNANSGVSPSTYRYIALGTSSTAVSSSDTALGTEVSAGGYSRQLTSAPTYSSGVITFTGTFTGFACTCEEFGLFDTSTSGNMFSHLLTGTNTIGSSDTFTVTYTVTES